VLLVSAPIRGLTTTARRLGFARGGYVPTGQIRWRVAQLHVGVSALTVAREFWHTRAGKFPRPIKRAVVRAALRAHAENRRLYAYVMGGVR
jgi:hypothetical protein